MVTTAIIEDVLLAAVNASFRTALYVRRSFLGGSRTFKLQYLLTGENATYNTPSLKTGVRRLTPKNSKALPLVYCHGKCISNGKLILLNRAFK